MFYPGTWNEVIDISGTEMIKDQMKNTIAREVEVEGMESLIGVKGQNHAITVKPSFTKVRIYVQDNFSHRRPLQLCCGACEQRSYDTVTAVTPPCTDCYSDYASYCCISLACCFSLASCISLALKTIFLFFGHMISLLLLLPLYQQQQLQFH